jgi:hypothetical protein
VTAVDVAVSVALSLKIAVEVTGDGDGMVARRTRHRIPGTKEELGSLVRSH